VAGVRYEIRLYPPEALGQSYRRSSSTGEELEAELGEPQRVLEFATVAEAAAAMPSLPNDLTPLVYAVDDDGSDRPLSVMELAQASSG
jgi:hypothetical protein